jgi:hypothetical protein
MASLIRRTAMTERLSKKGFRGLGRIAAISLGVVAAMAMPLSATAHDHDHRGGEYRGGYHGGYGGGHYDNYQGGNRGHWSGGRWIAGAIITGAVLGLVSDALRPAPVYYNPRVVYSQPPTVYYGNGYPVVNQRVVERRTVIYDNQSDSPYIRDDNYNHYYGYDRDEHHDDEDDYHHHHDDDDGYDD